MNKRSLILSFCLLVVAPTFVIANPFVDVETNRGTFTVNLNPEAAPISVANFLSYVDSNFYDNTLFHRVISNFMVQGGGFGTDLVMKQTLAPIVLESNNGLLNKRGTIAMARTNDPNSATAQFFINNVDNSFLDYTETNSGYAVFGEVVAGMEAIDSISASATNTQDIPLESVVINTVRRREGQLAFTALKTSYAVGEIINVSVQESGITREVALDLWAAILLPNGKFLYLTDDGVSFTFTPTVFKRAVTVDNTAHILLNFTIPEGISGNYTLFALFNEADKGVGDLLHSLRSNIVQTEISLTE
ncbi:MAG: peptidylprolyl isomerase [Methylococcales bacterium]|nr:peptidylprolyl isomerase [Methylococcales bacterium]